jgi:hypothetical protein
MLHLALAHIPDLQENVSHRVRQLEPRLNIVPFGWVDDEEEDHGAADVDRETRDRFSVLLQAADVVDSEIRSFVSMYKEDSVPQRIWALIHCPAEGASRVLYTFRAYRHKDATYRVLCHCTSPLLPRGVFPEDYPICIVAFIDALLRDNGRLADIMHNFVAFDLGEYHVVPFQDFSHIGTAVDGELGTHALLVTGPLANESGETVHYDTPTAQAPEVAVDPAAHTFMPDSPRSFATSNSFAPSALGVPSSLGAHTTHELAHQLEQREEREEREEGELDEVGEVDEDREEGEAGEEGEVGEEGEDAE